jgi:hypothetical protein
MELEVEKIVFQEITHQLAEALLKIQEEKEVEFE